MLSLGGVSRVAVLPALLLALVASAAPRLAGGQPSSPVFPVGLEAVHVTVAVQDKEGRFVPDLKAEDFAVLEDGRAQALQILARAVEPGNDDALVLDLGLLLDTSQSMLKEVKLSHEAMVRFLEAVPRARDLITIFFDEDIRISRYDSENQQGLFERIHAAKSAGRTALYDAIAVYLSRVQDTSGRKVLVLFTDGEDSISSTTLHEALSLIRSSPVTIYPIALLGGFPTGSARAIQCKAILQQMALLSGGQLHAPTSSRDLPEIYRQILEELRSQYVVGYVSENKKHDGKFRKLKVQVRREGLRVRHRPGYYAPGPAEPDREAAQRARSRP